MQFNFLKREYFKYSDLTIYLCKKKFFLLFFSMQMFILELFSSPLKMENNFQNKSLSICGYEI